MQRSTGTGVALDREWVEAGGRPMSHTCIKGTQTRTYSRVKTT